jgi:hypothetical protein
MEQSLQQLILPIKLERSSERLTSLGGLLVLEELARAAGVWEEVDRVLPGPKSGRGYQPREFVQALVWMLHAGGTRLEDPRELGAEQEVLRELGLKAVPDAGTVGDWLRRQGRAGAEALQQVSRGLVEACLGSEPEELILDVDATEIEAEKQDAQWTYHHRKGYVINRRPHAAADRSRAKTKPSPPMRLIPLMQEKIATIRKIAYSHAADTK